MRAFKLGHFNLILKPSLIKIHVWMTNKCAVILTRKRLSGKKISGKPASSV